MRDHDRPRSTPEEMILNDPCSGCMYHEFPIHMRVGTASGFSALRELGQSHVVQHMQFQLPWPGGYMQGVVVLLTLQLRHRASTTTEDPANPVRHLSFHSGGRLHIQVSIGYTDL